ncbi:hypothetical protein ACQ4PT_006471 [Festuca glaucescens]
MAGIVGSAIAGEAVRRLSSLLSGEDGRDRETTEIKVDRVEMAMLKLETVVAMSEDWQITHAPLLRWKTKLKGVLKEGKGIVRSHRRNTVRANMNNSFPRRMARVANRFMPFSSASTPDDDELTESTVRRFERMADGAHDFFEFVRCGDRPKILMFVPSFARSLSAGETMELSVRMEGGTAVMLIRPWVFELGGGGGGTEAMAFVRMSYEHDLAWERNFKAIAGIRTSSEAPGIMRVAPNCVVLLPPQFGASCVAAMRELVAGMGSPGRTSPDASAMYASFVCAIKGCVRTIHLKRLST